MQIPVRLWKKKKKSQYKSVYQYKTDLLQSYTNIIITTIFLGKVLIFILIISIETHYPIIFLVYNFLQIYL